MLSEDEKQAIEKLKKIREDTIKANECDLSNNDFKEEIEVYNTVLNLITKLQKENETTMKLNANMNQRHLNDMSKIKNYKKQIELMAEYIATLDIEEDICANVKNNNCDKMSFGECEDCIKQYFEKLAKKGE